MLPHGGTKIGQALRSLSDCMEHNCPSAQIIKALVHITHCTLGTLGYGHSAFPRTHTVNKHFYFIFIFFFFCHLESLREKTKIVSLTHWPRYI